MSDPGTLELPLGELYLRKRHPQKDLLVSSTFERHCHDRDININQKFLETFERDGVLRPLLRIVRPRIPYKKVRKTEAGVELEVLVPLAEGEDPAAATDYEYGGVSTDLTSLLALKEANLIIYPEQTAFKPWAEYRDVWGETTLAFYHPLQVLMLRHLQFWGTVTFQETLLTATPEEVAQRVTRAKADQETGTKYTMSRLAQDERLVRFLLVVEDAILPDLRGVFRGNDPRRDIQELLADWWTWQRGLDWKALIAGTGWSTDDVKNLYIHWAAQTQGVDPMDDWYLLVRNVPYEKRRKLKGTALLAQDFYEIALILKAAYEGATGEQLPQVDDVTDAGGGEWKVRWYGTRNVFEERQARLQLLTEYGLNPVVKVHLILEGTTERVVIEKLAVRFNLNLENSGIELHVLEGVGNLRLENLRLLLWHAVNEGAVGYVLVDDDEGVRDHIDDLLRKAGPSGQPLLRRELHRIWKGEFEEENFTTQDVASAFNQLAESLGSRIRISSDELEKRLVSSAGKPKKVTKALKAFSWEKQDFDFEGHREEFAGLLAQIVLRKIEDGLAMQGEYKPSTPIEEELRKVANLAYALGSGVRLGPQTDAPAGKPQS